MYANYCISIDYPELPLFQQPVFAHKDWLPFAQPVQLADTSMAGQQQDATLLQQALPQIPTAIYDSRDAVLQQGARLHSLVSGIVHGQLARLEGSVNCIIHSQLGAAQLLVHELRSAGILGAAQPAGQMSDLQLEPLSTSFPVALQPSAAESEARNASGLPTYTFIKAQTVADVWREYKEGIAGGPAVEELERLWQARWRPSQAQRITWCRRKIIINEILRLVQAGSTPADAVAQLEARRGSSSLRSLQTLIQAQKESQRA